MFLKAFKYLGIAVGAMVAGLILNVAFLSAATNPGTVPYVTTYQTATSSFAWGINLPTGGCFAIAGVCIGSGSSLFSTTSANYWLGTKTTSDLAEGVYEYFTITKARNALSTTATGLTYDAPTGVFSLTSGYNIPLTASTTEWASFFLTPSTRITAGTNLSWSGNTLNVTGVSGAWGGITGTLSDQTDLQTALDAKLSLTDFYSTTTTDIGEGTNLYYTSARATTAVSTLLAATTTTAIAEGNNLYWTNARFDTRLGASTSLPQITTLAGLTSYGTVGATTTDAGNLAVNGVFKLGTDYITDLTGTGLALSSGALTVSLANDYITPDMILSTGQTDEYCLTYEATGDTKEWQACGSGGGGDPGWATTTSSVAGQLNLYPINTTDILNIGGTATTASEFWFDPNTVQMAVMGSNGTSSTVIGSANNEWVLGTSDSDKSFRIASSTGTLDGVTAALSIGKGGTTTASNGFNITSGCFALNGVCLSTGGAPAWGSITGTLSNQTDLQSALNAKLSLADFYSTTTSDIGEGTNLYYTDARVNSYVHGSSTIPKTYTANTFTGLQTIGNASTTYTSATRFFGALTGDVTGTASLATALGANGANCSSGLFPLGVDASGAVETCTDAWTEAENTAAAYLNAAAVNAYIHSSSTIPKTYTANTYTGLQTFGNASSTMLSGTSLCIGGDCRTSWPTGGGGAPIYWLNDGTYTYSSTTVSMPAFHATSTTATSSVLLLSVGSTNTETGVFTNFTGTRMRFGPTSYPANYVPSCPTCAYFVMDKAATADDVSIVFRDQGNARAEIGLVGDNKLHIKTVSGTYGSESFTDAVVITNGRVGIGGLTDPATALDVLGTASTTNLVVGGGNGTLRFTADTDGGDYNIYSSNGAQTLALYGSAGNSLNLSLLDGALTVGGSTSTLAGLILSPTHMVSCGKLYTDANGNVTCGADATGGSPAWGSITGTLSDQTDLQSALNLKINNSTTTLPLIGTMIGLGNIGSSSATTTVAGNLAVDGVFKLGTDYVTDLTGTGITLVSGALTLDTTGTWSGNAGTASALAANGSNCSAGSAAGGVSALGVAEDCTDYWTEAENTSAAYLNTAGVNAYIHASSTIPKTYTANSYTAVQTIPNASTTYTSATRFFGALTGDVTGTASLATALGANGSNCLSGSAPLGVDASGAVESCFDVWTEAENTSAAYLNTAGVNAYIHGSTTIAKTYSANTFTALQTATNATTTYLTVTDLFSGTIKSGTWNGSTIGIAYGGTNATTFGSHMLTAYNGTSIVSTSSPVVGYVAATSTTASSSFQAVTATAFGIAGKFFASATQFVVTIAANFTAGLTVLDFLDIPSSTNPTVDAEGEIAVNTTAASSSLRFYDGTREQALDAESLPTMIFSSSTIASLQGNPSATSTLILRAGMARPHTYLSFYCKTNTGTQSFRLGDGTASTTGFSCGTSGTEVASPSNASFNRRETVYLEIGPMSSASVVTTMDVQYRKDAE